MDKAITFLFIMDLIYYHLIPECPENDERTEDCHDSEESLDVVNEG